MNADELRGGGRGIGDGVRPGKFDRAEKNGENREFLYNPPAMIGMRGMAKIASPQTERWRACFALLLALALALTPGLGWTQDGAGGGEEDSLWLRAARWPWETLFGWVQVKGVAEGLAYAILVLFFVVLARLVAAWRQNASVLNGFLGKIRGIPRGHYEFAEHYRQLILDMPGKPSAKIGHVWEEFCKSVFTEKDEEGKIIAYNTAPPEHFFAPEKLGMTFAVFRSLANYFVGVGLLLTFFGLAAALFEANKGIGGDVQTTQNALGALLNAATLKFMTSIAGLLSSIALSVVALIASRHVSRLCASICEELEARVQFAVQERFAMLQLRELREQTATLKKFSTDLAVSIAEQIAAPVSVGVLDALNKSGLPGLTKTMGKVSGDVESLMEKVDSVSGKLDSLAGNIAKEIESPVETGVASGMKGLEEKIEKLAKDVVKGGKEGVEEITKGIPEKIQEAANTIKDASDNLCTASEKLQGIASNLEGQIQAAGDQFSEKMKAASGDVKETVSGVGGQVTGLQNAVRGLREILDGQREKFQELASATGTAATALNSAADKHAQAARPIADAANRISVAAERIRDLGLTVQETHQSLEKLHAQIAKSNADLRGFWEQHDGRFAGVDERLGAVAEKILRSNEAYQGSVTKFFTDLAKKLEEALGQLGGAIQELGEVAEDLQSGKKERK